MHADAAVEVPVAVVLPALEAGGHERMLFEWLRAASPFGLRPTIYAHSASEPAMMARDCGFAHVAARYLGCTGSRRRLEMALNIRTTLAVVRDLPATVPVLLAPGAMQSGLSHLIACLLRKHPVACYVPLTHDARTLGASKPILRDAMTRALCQAVANWFVVAPQQAEDLRVAWGVSSRAIVIPNRLHVLSVPMASPRLTLVEPGTLTVLFAGRFDRKQKGLDWLVSAIDKLPFQGATRFIFQGRGDYAAELEELARQLPVGTVVVSPWGPVGEGLRQADLLLLPSRFEGFPLIAIEAIHAGVAVVATRQSGLTDVLPAEALVEFGDDAALVDAIDAMRDPKQRLRTLEHARARLDCLLSAHTYAQAVQDATLALRRLGSGARVRPDDG